MTPLPRFQRFLQTLAVVPALLIAAGFPAQASSFTTVHKEAATESLRSRWQFPCEQPISVLKPWIKPASKYTAGHRGVDFGNCHTIRAPESGKVSFVGKVVDRHVISVQVSQSLVYSFEPIDSDLSVGDEVVRGQILGQLSVGGHCADSCVHFGVRHHGEYLNPMRFFWDKPVLKPWRG